MGAETFELDRLIAALRALDGVGVAIVEEALPEVVKAAQATAAAGTDAYGTAWAPTTEGQPALAHAAAAITGAVSGSSKAVLTLSLPFPYAFHQQGKGRRKRPILPDEDQGAPPRMVDAIRAAAERVVARRIGGGA